MRKEIFYGGESIENMKRRRALRSSSSPLDQRSRLFFERILNVRKVQEFVFITKASAKSL